MANLVLTYVNYFVFAAKFTISYCSSYSKPGIKYVSLFAHLVVKVVEAESGICVETNHILAKNCVSRGEHDTSKQDKAVFAFLS